MFWCMFEKHIVNMKCLWTIIIALISGTHSIQTHLQRPIRYVDHNTYPSRNFHHTTPGIGTFDWEHGLREAAVQALLREHFGDPNLRQHIYSAAFLGKQDKATPFGDIAILARGQLYTNYASYIFVQDPYQNDCNDCHTIEVEPIRTRCINTYCQIWHPRRNEQLIALWSVKRLRHRSSVKVGFDSMELEYTISPVGLRYPKQLYLRNEGTYNYRLPGHVFLLKKAESYPNLDAKQTYKEGAFIAQSPDGRKFILHSFPGVLTTEPFGHSHTKDSLSTSSTTTTQYAEENAKKLYQKLLEALHKKTSLEPNRFTPPSQQTSVPPATTLVQFPDGQVVPITEVRPPFTTQTTASYGTIRFPETPLTKLPTFEPTPTTTSSQLPFRPSSPLTSQSFVPTIPQTRPQTYEMVSTTKQTAPNHFYTNAQQTSLYHPTKATTNKAEPRPFYTVDGIQRPQYQGTTQSLTTIKPPVKTTFHFFAAEEEKDKPPTLSDKKPVISTFHRQEATTENIWFESVTPTQPTKIPASGVTKYKDESTHTTKYQDTSRAPFTTVGSPFTGNGGKVPKPVVETTYNSNTSPYHGTQTSTTIIHSNTFEPSTNSYQTTHKPSTGFFIPITVLDNTSPEVNLKETFSTKDDEKIFTVPFHVTSSATNEPTFITKNVKYTSTQFYNPTTKLTPAGITTVQEAPSDSEIHEPTRTSTFSTTYESVSTDSTHKGPIETTLGVTTLMGALQTKTTDMVYYAAEETEPATTPTTYTEINLSSNKNVKPTNIPIKISTPKRILTTISADGTVSVKTTPFNSQEELFGSTKSSAKTYKMTKSYKASTTEASDFLVDTASQDVKSPLYKKPLKDYGEDDIFGSNRSRHSKTTRKPHVLKQYTKSDFERELFESNNRNAKYLRRKPTTEATPSKVISSDFFDASTVAMTTQSHVATLPSIDVTPTGESIFVSQPPRQTFSVLRTPKPPTDKTDRIRKQGLDKTNPVTSQSYLTSISYEVNRKRKPSKHPLQKNHRNATIAKAEIIDKATVPKAQLVTSQSNEKNIDDFAVRLLSQAKGVEYLNNAETTTATTIATASAKTNRKSKYTRRRTYVARTKKSDKKTTEKNRKTTQTHITF